MGKWTEAAKKLKSRFNERDSKASDMELLMSRIAKLPLGQLKKLLDDETVELFRKYGVDM